MKQEMAGTEERGMEMGEGSGIDSIIGRVDDYIKNPKMVTTETLMELRSELVDLKEYLDGEDESPGDGYNDSKDKAEGPGLMVMIGRAKRGMK